MTVRERVRSWLPVAIVGGVIAAGALVAIPLGGWDTVRLQSANVPEHPIGQPFISNRLSTAIDDIYLDDEHPDGYTEPEPGETFLFVVATFENLTDEPQFPLGSSTPPPFTVPGLYTVDEPPSLVDYWTYLVRDGSSTPRLNPGVPDTVMFVFNVPDDLFQEGDEVSLGLTQVDSRPSELLDGVLWLNERVVAEVPVVIREGR